MAGYELSDRFSTAGHGTVLQPQIYLPLVEQELPLYAGFWPAYTAKGQFQIFGPGGGKYWHFSTIADMTPTSTALSSGTPITTSDVGSTLTKVSGTLAEYGGGEYLENFSDWLSHVDQQGLSGVQWYRHAMLSANLIAGNAFIGASHSFIVDNGSTWSYDGATTGSEYLKPEHVRSQVSWARRAGLAPFDDGYYRYIGPPGAFDALKAESEVYSSAASLGLGELFTTGEIFQFGGAVFVEEPGANAVTTYSTTAGTSVFLAKNAVAGGHDFDRPNLITYYPDTGDDFGRRSKIGWTGRGGFKLVVDGSATARAHLVYSKHST